MSWHSSSTASMLHPRALCSLQCNICMQIMHAKAGVRGQATTHKLGQALSRQVSQFAYQSISHWDAQVESCEPLRLGGRRSIVICNHSNRFRDGLLQRSLSDPWQCLGQSFQLGSHGACTSCAQLRRSRLLDLLQTTQPLCTPWAV